MLGLCLRFCSPSAIHLQHDKEAFANVCFVQRSMLAELARRIRAHRAAGGAGDDEGAGSDEGGTRLVIGDDCAVQ